MEKYIEALEAAIVNLVDTPDMPFREKAQAIRDHLTSNGNGSALEEFLQWFDEE